MLFWVFCFYRLKVKIKTAQITPLVITAVVLLVAVSLHIVSRILTTQSEDGRVGWKQTVALTEPEQVEWLTYDARVKLGAALNDTKKVATNMATLFFDDKAFEEVNNGTYSTYFAPATNQAAANQLQELLWPWPRFIHGQIVRELKAEGATAIGFDVMFPELKKDNPVEHVLDPERGELTSDEFFALQMQRSKNVILAVDSNTVPTLLFQTNAVALASIWSQSDYAVLRRVRPYNMVRLWHPLIRGRVKSQGLLLDKAQVEPGKLVIPKKLLDEGELGTFEVPLNPNGSMRISEDGDIDFGGDEKQGPATEYPFVEKRVWNLGIEMAGRALGLDLDQPVFRKNKIILRGPNGLTRAIPVDRGGFFYIDWSLRFEDLKDGHTSIYYGHLPEVLINDYSRTHHGEEPANKFQDKIVLIGSVATGNNVTDVGATPLEAQTRLVTKHLNIANSILTGRFVERTTLPTEVVLIVALGAISALLTWRLRVLVASIAITGLTLSYLLVVTWMYIDHRYWIPMVMPVAGGLLMPHFSLVTYRVIFEQKEQRRVRGIFSKIVSPDVVQELLSVETLSLVGARRKVTVFFADVRGFTEFTDATQQAAEEYVAKHNLNEMEAKEHFDRIASETISTVNLYLATIADTVKKHNGTLDKYMGDCVMAFWGAPVANEHHARDCVCAAITAQRAVYDLNQKRFLENENRKKENELLLASGKPPRPFIPMLSLGTGINSGYVTVGLMGSDATIVNYTVFGREVNLASRLEGASGRGRIFIGESTYLELKRDAPELAASCIPQNPITTKGFRQAIPIYEVHWKECVNETIASTPAVPAAA